MNQFKLWRLLLYGGIMLLSSCALPYTTVTDRNFTAPERFTVELPQGWRSHNASADPVRGLTAALEKRRKLSWDIIRLTRDGLLLQQIAIGRIPVAEELPHTKKNLTQGMIPLESAEVIVDEFRSNTDLTNHEVVENSPAQLGGHSGFKLHYTYRAEDRLKMEGLFYGALVGPWLYYMLYEAPAQHYFKKDLQLFEKTRETLKIEKESS